MIARSTAWQRWTRSGYRCVLPELDALRGVSQSPYHHLDVYEHTRAVLVETIALQRDLRPASPSTRAAWRLCWASRSQMN